MARGEIELSKLTKEFAEVTRGGRHRSARPGR